MPLTRPRQELEGVVAKRLNEPYRSGERAWIKTKNRDYWRFEIEREAALKISRPRASSSSCWEPWSGARHLHPNGLNV